MWPFKKKNVRPPPAPTSWNLSDTVLQLSKHDRWTIGDACQGCQIWGATGSGKTSGSFAWIVRSYLKLGFGGIFFTVKPTDTEQYLGYCREMGREKDVILFGPDHDQTFNFIDSELQRKDRGAGHVENLVALFTTVLEISERNQGGGGGREEEGYWKRTNRQLLRNLLELLVQARGKVKVWDLYQMALSAPMSPDEVKSKAWQDASFCYTCMLEADAKCTPKRKQDLLLATNFFCSEWPNLSEKTRSIVLSTLTSMLDVLSRGVVNRLLSPEVTTMRPEIACDGKILIIDMPLKLYGEIGLIVQIILKYCFQLAMERRDIEANSRPTFMAIDESHLLVTSKDQVFQTTARSSRTAVIYATQSISNYMAVFNGQRSESEVHSLLGNLQTSFFHQQSNTETNNYASELIGRTKQYLMNSNTSWGPVDWMDVVMGGSNDTGSSSGMNESYEFEIQPNVFNTLAQGGPPDWRVEAIVVQGGKRFHETGRPWLPVSIRQKF